MRWNALYRFKTVTRNKPNCSRMLPSTSASSQTIPERYWLYRDFRGKKKLSYLPRPASYVWMDSGNLLVVNCLHRTVHFGVQQPVIESSCHFCREYHTVLSDPPDFHCSPRNERLFFRHELDSEAPWAIRHLEPKYYWISFFISKDV